MQKKQEKKVSTYIRWKDGTRSSERVEEQRRRAEKKSREEVRAAAGGTRYTGGSISKIQSLISTAIS